MGSASFFFSGYFSNFVIKYAVRAVLGCLVYQAEIIPVT